MKIKDHQEDFNEFAELFKEKVNEINILNTDSGLKTDNSVDKLTELYESIKESYDNLNSVYSDTLSTKQKEVADTFVQTLQQMIYYISLKKDYEEYKKLSQYIASLFGKSSSLMDLLAELDQLILLYVNLNKYNCSSADDVASFEELEDLTLTFNTDKYDYNQCYSNLSSQLDILNTYLCEYDENIYVINAEQNKQYKILPQIEMSPSLSDISTTIDKIHTAHTQNNLTDYAEFTIDGQKYVYATIKNEITTLISTMTTLKESMETTKAEIAEIHIVERDNLKAKIELVIQKLIKLLNILITQNSLLPEYELEEADPNGHHEIKATPKVQFGGARSFSVKTFKKNRFCGYMGSVDRSGYVGQKAQLFLYIPVNKSNTIIDRQFYLTSPLLHINNVKYEHNADYMIKLKFLNIRLFNKYDYVGINRIENDGSQVDEEAKSEADAGDTSEYINTKTYFRFDGLLSDLGEVDINKNKHSCRLKCDEESSWVSGKINKKGIFELSDVSVIGKFDGETVATDLSSYDPITKFADAVDFSMKITAVSNGETYTYSGEGLSYDEDYTISENAKLANGERKSSYFKGTIQLSKDNEEEDPELSKYSDTTVNLSSYGASKEVIIKLTSTDNSAEGYSIEMYLDPDSSSNESIYEDSGNDEMTYLPLLAANIHINYAPLKNTIKITGPKLETVSALLDLTQLINEDLDPFDEDIYAGLLDNFNNAKNRMLQSLLEIIAHMDSIALTVSMANTIYASNDSLYTSAYTEDFTTFYGQLQSVFTEYTSSASTHDKEQLYDGTFIAQIEPSINDISNLILDNMDDCIECEGILYNYDNKICKTMEKARNNINFSSTLNVFYNTVTGESQTLTTMATAGQKVVKYRLNLPYNEWINYFDLLPNGKFNSHEYFIDVCTLQYLYIISQTYKTIRVSGDIDERNLYCPAFEKVDKFYRYLLLRILKENTENVFYRESADCPFGLFKAELVDILKNYKIAEQYIECSYLDFNKYYINPYLSELFPSLEQFNTINIDDITAANSRELVSLSRAFIYKSILETNATEINSKLQKFYNFIHNGQKLNVRELILAVGFSEVVNDLKDTVTTENIYGFNDTRYAISTDIHADDDNLNYLQYILDYRKYATMQDGSATDPIDLMLNMKLVDQDADIENIIEIIKDKIDPSIPTEPATIARRIYSALPATVGEFDVVYNYVINCTIYRLTLPWLLKNSGSIYPRSINVSY